MDTVERPRSIVRRPDPPRPTWPLSLFLAGLGALMIVAGIALDGSSWILPDGLLGGGVALLVSSPWSRSMLDPLVVSSPFLFYTLSPVGGILTAGTSDVLVPGILVALLAGAAVARTRRVPLPSLPWAMPLALGSIVVVVGSTVTWAIASADFLLGRAIADCVKMGIGVAYFVATYVLVVRSRPGAIDRSLQLWAWTASALSLGSLASATGAADLVPTDGYRSLGYFQDANLYAGYLLISLSIVLYLGLQKRSFVIPLHGLLIVAGLVTTGSRGGFGGLAVLLLFAALAINSARLRASLIAGVGVATIFGYWYLSEGVGRVPVLGLDRLLFASQDVGEDPRLALWQRAVQKWLDAPVWGIGAGQFERFTVDVEGSLRGNGGLGYSTHNTVLYFMVSFGVLGALLFVALVTMVARSVLRAGHITRNSRNSLLAGLIVLTSQMMTLNLQNQRYLWVYLALCLGLAVRTPGTADGAAAAADTDPPSRSRPTRSG